MLISSMGKRGHKQEEMITFADKRMCADLEQKSSSSCLPDSVDDGSILRSEGQETQDHIMESLSSSTEPIGEVAAPQSVTVDRNQDEHHSGVADVDIQQQAGKRNDNAPSSSSGTGNSSDQHNSGDLQFTRRIKEHFKGLLSKIGPDSGMDSQLDALNKLCYSLSVCQEGSIDSLLLEEAITRLVELARKETNPNAEIMLFSIRALSHICNMIPRSSSILTRHNVVPTFCSQLMTLEYIDVAEQSLQALEKISRLHPVICYHAEAIIASLQFVEFFSTSIQKVALKTVANITRALPADSFVHIKEALPILSSLLERDELVESVVTCLINIVRCLKCSSDLADELCNIGLFYQAASLVSMGNQIRFNDQTCAGLIGMLSILASNSVMALEALLDMHITATLKNIIQSCSFSCTMAYSSSGDVYTSKVQEVLKLLNRLLPPLEGEDEKTQILPHHWKNPEEKSALLLHFGMDILPVLFHVVGCGGSSSTCYGCLCIIHKLFCHSTSDELNDMLNNNVSSFLAGVLSVKDFHVLIRALQVVEVLLQKLPQMVEPFVKEGVASAVTTLSSGDDTCDNIKVETDDGSNNHPASEQKGAPKGCVRCLFFSLNVNQALDSPNAACRLSREMVQKIAVGIRDTYFCSILQSSSFGPSDTLQKIKVLCAELGDDEVIDEEMTAQHENHFYVTLDNLMKELSEGEQLSTFQFMESGISTSLLHYLSSGKYTKDSHECGTNYSTRLQKRFQSLAKISFSSSSLCWENMPSSILVAKLLSALSTLEQLPVINSHAPKSRNVYADLPKGRYTLYPCLKVQFVRHTDEKYLSCPHGVLRVEPFTSLDDIENYLWPVVSKVESNNKVQGSDFHDKSEDRSSAPMADSGELGCSSNTKETEGECSESSSKEMASSSLAVTSSGTAPASLEDCSLELNECDCPKLEFYYDGRLHHHSLTIYQAIQQTATEDGMIGPRLWSDVHKISFRRALECEHKENDREEKCLCVSNILPDSNKWTVSLTTLRYLCSTLVDNFSSNLGKLDLLRDVLVLLTIFECLNRSSTQLIQKERLFYFAEGRLDKLDCLMAGVPSIPQTMFISSKLTEKMEQQLQDPLAKHTGCLPSWWNQMMMTCPFLFSFDVRRKYFQLFALESLRSNQRYSKHQMDSDGGDSSSQRSPVADIARKEVAVNREFILDSTSQMMELHANQKFILDIVYEGEVGTGLGPSLEFYILVSQEFQKVSLEMWRDTRFMPPTMTNGGETTEGVVLSPFGLFPRPWTRESQGSLDAEKRFFLLGQVVSKALQDRRMLDLPFSRAFYKLILEQNLDLYDIQTFEPELGRTLQEFQGLLSRKNFLDSNAGDDKEGSAGRFRGVKIEDLSLDFTLPGYPDYVLNVSSKNDLVDIDNLEEYVSLVVDATVGSGITRQVEAFRKGFNQFFPLKGLQIFTPEELDRLLCGERDAWACEAFHDHIKFDHGYTSSSPSVTNLLEILQEFDYEQQSAFLRFVTGAPRLPPGGLAALNPKFTVVRKCCVGPVDLELPSVMTCANYLKLPPYSTKDKMRERLVYAITEGQRSFHLS